MPRGGRRTGTQGKQYSNRADLQQRSNVVPIAAATGQAYGERGAQIAAQRAVPMARPATDMVPPAGPSAPAAQSAPPPGPQIVPLSDPTARPGEPVTAGLPVGPGAGPEVLGDTGGRSELRMRLGAMYMAFPTEEIRQMIEMLDSEPS